MRSPILFLVFNRPEVTQRVFDSIRAAQPPKLYIASDDPRKDKVGEAERCAAVQEIVSQVDWPCEVSKLIRQENLGCKIAVSSAIDWFFSCEPEGIILEDDCLPEPSFFQFCDELLECYRNDERVGMISGTNFQGGTRRGNGDYYFSRFCHIWGWASWARAWSKYDVTITQWPALKKVGWLKSLGLQGGYERYWEKVFDKVKDGQIDTWDHQWTMASWINGMFSVMPNVNLVRNIGFGAEATHTVGASIYADMDTAHINFPLDHPAEVKPDAGADGFTAKRMFSNSITWRVIRKLQTILGA